jgi:predicted ABC-type ATPase
VPSIYLLAGPNGSGKSTFVQRVLGPVTRLPFINADLIAAERWPEAQMQHAHDASRAATQMRNDYMQAGKSFITETVFSHESKVELVEQAHALGWDVHLHVMMVPVEVTVRRVAERVRDGGHDVPEGKIRARYARLWAHIARARGLADRTRFYDNSVASEPFRKIAEYQNGILIGEATWPAWTPSALL